MTPAVRAFARGVVGAAAGAAVGWWNRHDSALLLHDRSWAFTAAIVLSALLAIVLPSLHRMIPKVPVLSVAISIGAAAVFACVPETNNQMGAVAMIVVLGILAEVHGRALLPWAWHFFAAEVVLAAGLYGATDRQSALIGTVFSWWPLLILPLVARLDRRTLRVVEPARWIVVALGGVAALVVARTGAIQQTAAPALRWAMLCAMVSTVVSLVVVRLAPLAADHLTTIGIEGQ